MTHKQLPKHVLLKQEIERWIVEGRLQPHDQMPSENEIAEQSNMSRQTVRQALSKLEQDGLLFRLQGKGTFVAVPAQQQLARSPRTIGMITTYISDYIFPHIVRGAEGVLRSKGYRLLLSSTDNDKAKEGESLSLMLSEPLSGLIIEPTKSAQGNPNLSFYLSLNYRKIPFIMINESYPEMICPVFKVDDELGGYRAASHLIHLGHRRIAGFFKTDDLQGVNRLKGFVRAHREQQLPLLPADVISYTTEQKQSLPYEAALAMLTAPDRPSAFVCYNDELALQLLEAARSVGLAVPADLSIIGFDDSSLSRATEVKLTTLSHPKTTMGIDAAELLIQMIEEQDLPVSAAHSKAYIYDPVLIERDSVKPYRQD